MKKMTHIFFITALLFVPTSFLLSEKDNTSSSKDTESLTFTQPQDATDEINAMDNSVLLVTHNEDSKEIQALLNSFAGIIGNFFNIIQDPNNEQSLANMIGGTINFAFKITNNSQLSSNANRKEIARFVKTFLDNRRQLKKRFIKLVIAKKIPIS